MTTEDMETRVSQLERAGVPPLGTTIPIKAPPMSASALAKAAHDDMRRAEWAAHLDEERRLREQPPPSPPLLDELRGELVQVDEWLAADLAGLENLGTAQAPDRAPRAVSWFSIPDHNAKEEARLRRQLTEARVRELQIRRERVVEAIAKAEEWERNAPARAAALAELPAAESLLRKIGDELDLVEAEHLQALHRVQSLREEAGLDVD